jgi:hypothetical protein
MVSTYFLGGRYLLGLQAPVQDGIAGRLLAVSLTKADKGRLVETTYASSMRCSIQCDVDERACLTTPTEFP